MRLLLTALLLTSPAATAATLNAVTPIPGHAADSFGLSENMGPLAGGAAWSADSSTVWTLDTTRELKRWRISDGALLRGQRLRPPAALPDKRPDFPNARLTLSGVATASGLPITARGYRGSEPVELTYRLNTGTGQETQQPDCPPSMTGSGVCTPDGSARAWAAGGELQWQRGEQVERLRLPAGLSLKPEGGPPSFSLGLSPDGGRLALLLLSGKDSYSGGKGTLLTWQWNAGGAVQAPQQALLGDVLLHPGAQLGWVGERVLLASNVYNTGSGGSRLGQLLSLVTPGQGPVWSLGADANLRGAFPSPDGRLFVTVRGGSVPEVRRVADGGFVRSLGAAVRDAVPLSGGRTLLAVQDGAGFGRIVRHGPGRLETLYRGPKVPEHLAANADGSRIAAVSGDDGRTLRLLDASGRVLREWRARERVSDLAFSPDGLVLSAALGWGSDDGVQAWRVADGTAYPLPQGTRFPVSQVVVRPQGRQKGPLVAAERGTDAVLWKLPEKASVRYAVPSPDGAWLAGTGLTPASTEQIPPNMERGTVNRLVRVDARTGKSGPVLNVPVAHPDDPYAGWGIAAFDGERALLSESSGDGCGASLYGYKLADLAAGRTLNTPAQLASGYARLMGCGHFAPRPEADFAPDGRLLIQDGNRLDWWTLK
ncbi:MAG: WD40 repeat domain-containing protein [Deinococcus sp.]|nr:WD40 repeat domain-containing protein [Deinococcus sp.]